MGRNMYNNNDNQSMNGFNGGYQMGYQRRGIEFPPLGPGSQYGTVQGGRTPAAAGYRRNVQPLNDVQEGTQGNTRRNTSKAVPGGVRNVTAQRGAKEEVMKQKAAPLGTRGGTETG